MFKLLAIAFSGITATAWVSTHSGLVNNKDSYDWLRKYSAAFKNNKVEDEEIKGENKSIEGLAINIKWEKNGSGGQGRKDIIGKCLSSIKDNSNQKFWESLGKNDWLNTVLGELQVKKHKDKVDGIDETNWLDITGYIKKAFVEESWIKSLTMLFARCSVEDDKYQQDRNAVTEILGNMDSDDWSSGSWENSEGQEKRKLRWLLAVNKNTEDPFKEIRGSADSEVWELDSSKDCSWTPKGNKEYESISTTLKFQSLWRDQNSNKDQCYVRAGKFTA